MSAEVLPQSVDSRNSWMGRKIAMTENFKDAVVLAAANRWDGVPMADQQLAKALSRHTPVIYVDPPQSLMTRYRATGKLQIVLKPRIEYLGERLIRVTPEVLPGLSRPLVAQVNRRIIAKQVSKAMGDLDGNAAAVIEANILTSIMGLCGEGQQVYWAQDDFAGMASLVGNSRRAYQKAEARIARQADRIIAANPLVADTLRAQGLEVDLIPFGCDFEVFRKALDVKPANDVDLPGPIAVFMGHIGDRIDLEILEAVAQNGSSILLVGPRHPRTDLHRFETLLAFPNVQWVGAKPFHELDQYLAHGTVGLLPYNLSDFNLGSFPLKTLEYLAAGLPVVATRLPAMSWLNTEHIHLADSSVEFAELTSRLLAEGRDSTESQIRSSFAAGHTWDDRANAFAGVLGIEPRIRKTN